MVEKFTIENVNNVPPKKESRFGDVEKNLEIMRNGEPKFMGPIETIIDVSPHANEVDVVDISFENNEPIKHANEVDWIIINDNNTSLRCVFKPFDGEVHEPDARSGESFLVKKFYIREYAAFLISEHFDLDLVPTTVIGEVDGRIGSIQLFVNPENYQPYSKMTEFGLNDIKGEDFNNMAAFDWLLANCERHVDNYLVNVNRPSQLVGIDHGVSLSISDYWGLEFRGPSLALSWDNKANRPRSIDVPEETIAKFKKGLENIVELRSKLSDLGDIDQFDIDKMIERAQKLVDTGKFLSKHNCREIAGYNCFG